MDSRARGPVRPPVPVGEFAGGLAKKIAGGRPGGLSVLQPRPESLECRCGQPKDQGYALCRWCFARLPEDVKALFRVSVRQGFAAAVEVLEGR